MSHRRPRPLHALVPALLALALLAGCTVSRPEGPSPLRYRDAVFTAVDRTNDIQYGSAPDRAGNPEALKLDLYQPSGDTIAKRPVLIWIHGGGFIQGDKASGSTIATYFAKLGYVTASINYRLLSPGGCAGRARASARMRRGGPRRTARRPGRGALVPGPRRAVPDRPRAHRLGRRVRGRHHLDPRRHPLGGPRRQRQSRLLLADRRGRVGVRRAPHQRDHHLRRRSHDLLPRDRGQDGVLRTGRLRTPRPCWTTACRPSSSPSRVPVTA